MSIRFVFGRSLARAAIVAATGVLCAAAACSATPRPNVLLLVLDTTRADRCGFLGYDRPTTPRLDAFAREATSFRHAFSPANWTGPAHATLFTGLLPSSHGFQSGGRPRLGSARPTIAERFRDAGYATACFTNNEFISPEFGLTRGFERVERLFADEDRSYPWAPATHAAAIEWALAAHADGKPFFLFVNDMEPHLPYTPPENTQSQLVRGSPSPEGLAAARAFSDKQATAYNVGAAEVPEATLSLLSDLYDAEIASLDREVGALLDRLRAEGLLDSTVVVIAGDHGEYLGEHGLVDHGHGLHRQVLHVPLLVRYPGWFDRGRRVPDVVRLEDVAPTLLEVCGLPRLPVSDGQSLAAGLGARLARAWQAPQDLLAVRARRDLPGIDRAAAEVGIRSVLDGKWHLLEYSDGRRELYDLVNDPAETTNVADQNGEEVLRLAPLLPNGE